VTRHFPFSLVYWPFPTLRPIRFSDFWPFGNPI
jgi:hypothetical protein